MYGQFHFLRYPDPLPWYGPFDGLPYAPVPFRWFFRPALPYVRAWARSILCPYKLSRGHVKRAVRAFWRVVFFDYAVKRVVFRCFYLFCYRFLRKIVTFWRGCASLMGVSSAAARPVCTSNNVPLSVCGVLSVYIVCVVLARI